MERGSIGPWVLGAVAALVALIGLFMASRAGDVVFYGTGLALFIIGILFIFALINRYVGR